MTDRVVISECFARDGLQHESAFLPTETKIALLERFGALGFQRIEATSYSNPQVVPQFADASAVLAGLRRRPGVHYKATCANLRAVERANADHAAGHGATEISLLASASEAHSRRNLRASRDEQWQRIAEMTALAEGRYRLIGSLSVAFGCPFEGPVPRRAVIEACGRFAALGVTHVSLGDTTGLATPPAVRALLALLARELPEVTPIAHFHDTRGSALANCVAALEAGCRWFDSAFGGVGGHPAKVAYGEGHTGNVATEDLVNLFAAMGLDTGLDLEALLPTALYCETVLGRPLQGRVTRGGLSSLIGEPA